MSSSNASIISLVEMPLDLLEAMLTFLPTRMVLRLYYTGHKRLQYLIKECALVFHFSGTSAPRGILPLVTQFSRLRELHFERCYGCAESWHFTLEAIRSLPESLKVLQLSFGGFKDEHIKELPRQLQTLILNGSIHSLTTAVKFLPPTLQSFRASSLKAMKPQFFQELPKGLTCLEVGGKHSLPEHLISSLPQCLTDLILPCNNTISDAGVTKLPPHLTRLNLNSNTLLTSVCAPVLPRTLKFLYIGCSKVDIASLPHFPPGLIEVAWPSNLSNELRDSDIPLLPRNLLYLPMRGSIYLTSACVSDLPLPLRSQSKMNFPVPVIRGLALEYVALLPRDMTVLHLPMWLDPYLSDELVPHLPRTIEKIWWKHALISDLGLVQMPPSLTILHLADASNISSQALASLPESLTLLELPKATQIDDAGLANLPRRLKFLDLNLNRKISDNGLPLLPPSLEVLYLQTNNLITDVGIPHLPRTLTVLDLSWNRKLTDLAIPSLPRNLTELNLSSCKLLTDQACPHFPKSLTRLALVDAEKMTRSAGVILNFVSFLKIPNHCRAERIFIHD